MRWLIWIPLGMLVAFFVARTIMIRWYQRYIAWEVANRRGMAYYGRPLLERQAFRQQIQSKARWLLPWLTFETNIQPQMKAIPFFEYNGVHGPTYSCTPESFHAAATYKPAAEDIFVATQMKSGTTWMQQVVYEILCKGQGDLSDSSHHHMYATSPWIEAIDGVSMDKAPLIGDSRKRLIKTHMPTQLCPYSPDARYIYVIRHPVSCFASIVDYFTLMAGPLAPPLEAMVQWYCSDQMWWLPWPEHVAGWWDRSVQHPQNVLLVHFEDMKKDAEQMIRDIARFLGETLAEEQVKQVAYKSGFQYMKEHEDLFEMCPPNMFSVSGTYFKSGQTDRHKDIEVEHAQKILAFCREKLRGRAYPGEKFYAELAS
jgi:hypothetical protein